MKYLLNLPAGHFALICLALIFCAQSAALAQNKTIILVRHAEKVDAVSTDPELSDAGRARALALMRRIKKYRPGAVYSTDFKRTRDTAAPIAEKRKKPVQIYDARQPAELINRIMASRTKRFVIVGHSNTIPGLVNLIVKKELFRNLDDFEYGTIWLIRIRKGLVQKVEVLGY